MTILLKGPTDIISDGNKTFVNVKKIPAMTVGGTGDVLSGMNFFTMLLWRVFTDNRKFPISL